MITGLNPSIWLSSFCQLDQRLELLRAAGFQAVDRVLGHDREEREVDGVDAFAQDGPLPAALTQDRLCSGLVGSPPRKRAGVLEVVAGNDLAQRLARQQRLAVAGVDITDLALRHRDQRHLVDAVLPAPESEMQAAAQHLRLKPRLAIQRDDPPLGHRTLDRPELLDDPDPVVGDVAQAGQLAEHDDTHDQAHDPDKAARQIRQGRDDRRKPDAPNHGRNDATCSTVVIPRHSSVNERERLLKAERSANETQPLAVYPIFRLLRVVHPPYVTVIRRREGILEGIPPATCPSASRR